MSWTQPEPGAGEPAGWNETSSPSSGVTTVTGVVDAGTVKSGDVVVDPTTTTVEEVGAAVVGATVVGAGVVGAAVVGAAVVGAAVVDVGPSTGAIRMAVSFVWLPPAKATSIMPSVTSTRTVDSAIGSAEVVDTRSWASTPSTCTEWAIEGAWCNDSPTDTVTSYSPSGTAADQAAGEEIACQVPLKT